MTWTIYVALIVGSLAVAGAAVYLVVRALQAWRDLKRLRRHLLGELDRLASKSKRASKKAERVTDQPRLTQSLERLRVGLARLAVLRSALDEATAPVRLLASVYPRK